MLFREISYESHCIYIEEKIYKIMKHTDSATDSGSLLNQNLLETLAIQVSFNLTYLTYNIILGITRRVDISLIIRPHAAGIALNFILKPPPLCGSCNSKGDRLA